MALYAISDLHLALGMDKPMDIFGARWENHAASIETFWNETVSEQDSVVIPGDISWGMTLAQSAPDFSFLERLPGQKIILKGNHDYWWSSVTKIEKFFTEQGFSSIRLLKNNCFRIDETTLLCGTRGWILPCEKTFREADDVIFKREIGRLQASLSEAEKIRSKEDRIVAAMHYPPLLPSCRNTPFTEAMEEFHVSRCLYGHLHGNTDERSFEGEQGGVAYRNVSADKLAFKPLRL